jgi:hypothetical protein
MILKENLIHLLILVFVTLSISFSFAQDSEIKLKSESKSKKTYLLLSSDNLSDQKSKTSNSNITNNVSELYAWCSYYGISVFSKEEYDAMTIEERSNVDRLTDKIIFEGAELSVEDIKAYKQSKN